MANLNYRAMRFHGPLDAINCTWTNASVSRTQFLTAMVRVGATGFADLRRFGAKSQRRAESLVSLCDAMLEWEPNGFARTSALFRACDRSEKTSVSYFVGMGMAKVFAWRLLRVAWLMHVDRVQMPRTIRFKPGRSRPDLIGRDTSGRWHVAEAKGRSGGTEATLVSDAKAQAARVLKVGGSAPASTFVSLTQMHESPMSVLFDDPKPRRRPLNPVEWPMSDGVFFPAYYQTLIDWLQSPLASNQTVGGVTCKLIPFGASSGSQGWLVGLPLAIVENPIRAAEVAASFQQNTTGDADGPIGPDGLVVLGI